MRVFTCPSWRSRFYGTMLRPCAPSSRALLLVTVAWAQRAACVAEATVLGGTSFSCTATTSSHRSSSTALLTSAACSTSSTLARRTTPSAARRHSVASTTRSVATLATLCMTTASTRRGYDAGVACRPLGGHKRASSSTWIPSPWQQEARCRSVATCGAAPSMTTCVAAALPNTSGWTTPMCVRRSTCRWTRTFTTRMAAVRTNRLRRI
mmetsp:Transcript_3275/g.6866  ORF Transcript_3275/g.6866 Transcript_3275/m.6866 type:complete len:209 (+) Transcript_3275:580-1206(+)